MIKNIQKFKADLADITKGDYSTDNGATFIKGNALTYTMSRMRDKGWRLSGGWSGFHDAVKEAGFKVVKARTIRWYHGGKIGLGVPCECVTSITPPPEPFNPVAHSFLLLHGYHHDRHEADWEDIGDAENGPSLVGGPGFDEYTNVYQHHHVYVGEDGKTGEAYLPPEPNEITQGAVL